MMRSEVPHEDCQCQEGHCDQWNEWQVLWRDRMSKQAHAGIKGCQSKWNDPAQKELDCPGVN